MDETLKQLGLIGRPLSHSFSKSYFTNKFEKQGITDFQYQLFELTTIEELIPLLKSTPNLVGLNVTIPYKQEVLPYLDEISPEAKAIGAVNVIKIEGGKLFGFNSDYFGFKTSLQVWLGKDWQGKALVLGTGGASLAVHAALNDLGIPAIAVSRTAGQRVTTYSQVKQQKLQTTHKLWVNTTPLGMHPNIESAPDLDYEFLDDSYALYDLVYNPTTTRFMKSGMERGAKVKNGLEMLELQAEKSWEIWR